MLIVHCSWVPCSCRLQDGWFATSDYLRCAGVVIRWRFASLGRTRHLENEKQRCYNKFLVLVTRLLLIKLTYKAIQSKKVVNTRSPCSSLVGEQALFYSIVREFIKPKNIVVMTTNRVAKQPTSEQHYLVNCWRNTYDPKMISPKDKKHKVKQAS